MRMDMVVMCLQNPGMEAYLFRRTNPELQANHIRVLKKDIPQELYTYNSDQKRFEFINKSAINCCYCEREDDVTRYQGAEIHYLGIDEAAHLTANQLVYLRTRVRLGSWEPAEEYKNALPKIVFTSNPGGPGHNFLKDTFINPAPPETIFLDETTGYDRADGTRYQGHKTIYIPAGMKDNQYLDETYEGQFTALEPELAKALRDGDWDAVVGQALHSLSKAKHMLRQFDPPKHWTKFMVIDWGTAKPFSVGWYCVSEGAVLKGKNGEEDKVLPAGAIIRYREYYGWNGKPDKGCKMASQQVARKILEIEDGEVIDRRIGDTEMWAVRDGPSIQENMFNATEGRFSMIHSVKDRKQNYNEMLARLAGNPRFMAEGVEEEDPMLFITENCTHFWRTVPTLILDSTNPEKGPATVGEDHVYDETAYACRSRPFITTEEDRFMHLYGEDMEAARGGNVDPYATR